MAMVASIAAPTTATAVITLALARAIAVATNIAMAVGTCACLFIDMDDSEECYTTRQTYRRNKKADGKYIGSPTATNEMTR